MTTTPTPHDGKDPDQRETPRDHDVATAETPIERAIIVAGVAPVDHERPFTAGVASSPGTGPNRRRTAADVLRYPTASRADQRAAVAEMVALSQELGLE